MAKRISWMNIYRSGHFHREGKPLTLDCHSGDFYDTKEQAIEVIDPPSHHLATVSFEWDDPTGMVLNPANSVPVPLSVSRKRFYAGESNTVGIPSDLAVA
jgi:hypothetical protein